MLEVGKNTYLTLEEAESYFENRLPHSQIWEDVPESIKIKSLIQSAKEMEKYHYKGRKLAYTQTLSFPRYYHYYYDNTNYLNLNLSGEIYQEVRDCQCEIALAFLTPQDSRKKLQADGVTKVSFGDISEEYDSASIADAKSVSRKIVREILGDWIVRGVSL